MAGEFSPFLQQPLEYSRTYSNSPLPGLSTGRPSIDLLLNLLLRAGGNSFTPRPIMGTNQSQYDSYLMRDRNLGFLAARNNAFANSLFAQQLGGINPNSPAFQVLSALGMTAPDGMVMRTLSPLMGGNPVKAQMGMYADLTGQTMGAFGRVRNVSIGETDDLMKATYRNFFHTEDINTSSINKYRDNSLSHIAAKYGQGSAEANYYQKALGFKQTGEGMSYLQRELGSEDNGRLADRIEEAVKAIQHVNDNGKLTANQKQDEIKKIKDEARDAANEFLNKITDSQAVQKLSQAFTKGIEDSSYGAKGFRKDFSVVNADLIRSLRGVQDYEGRKGETIARSINFANTRGFQIDELTQGFASAAGYRLVGRGGLSQIKSEFDSNAIPVLDAAREIYGNDKSAKELTSNLNQLLGTSYVNLGDKTQAGQLESLLRNIKATARVQGVSTSEILGLINQGKQAASMNPSLQYLGGMEISNMAMRSMMSAGAQTSYLSNDYVRREGGPVAFAEGHMAGELLSAAEPVVRRSAAMYEYFAGRGNTKAANEISEYAAGKNKNFKLTANDFTQFIGDLASRNGENPIVLQNFAENNLEAASLGLRRKPELAAAGGAAIRELYKQFLYSNSGEAGSAALELASGGGHVTVDSLTKKYKKLTGSDKEMLSALQTRMEAGETLGPSEIGAVLKLPDRFGLGKAIQDNRYFESFMEENDPNYKAIKERDTLYRNKSAEISAQMAKQFAHLNAPIITGLFNQLLNGSIQHGGIMELLSPLRENDPNYLPTKQEIERVDRLGTNRTAANLADEYSDVLKKGGEGQMTNLLKVTSDLSYEDIRRYAKGGEKSFNAEIAELSATNRDPAKLAKLKALNYGAIASAAGTLNIIDPESGLTGHMDLYEAARRRGVEKIARGLTKGGVDTFNKNINEEFNAVLRGEGLSSAASKETRLKIQDDFSLLKDKFKSFGIYDEKTKTMDAVKFEKLRSDHESETGRKFQEFYQALSDHKDETGKAVKGTIGKDSYALLNSMVGTHEEGMTDVNAQVKALMASIDSSKGLTGVTDAMRGLADSLGSDFGTKIVNAIADLANKLDTATRN